MKREVIIKETHRGLLYEDGVFKKLLEAGRYVIPYYIDLGIFRTPKVEIVLVDVRQRDLTIKNQEILTSDKVAIRVSIIVQFRVTDPASALHVVEQYHDRLYSDVQLAARRSLASMTLEEILTNRNKLSEDILSEVKEVATTYGVGIIRADVKDLIFPGNLQEVMNRVLAAERVAEAQLVEARTRAQTERIAAEAKAASQKVDAEARAAAQRFESEAESHRQRLVAETRAEMKRIETEAGVAEIKAFEAAAVSLEKHPVLVRLKELESLNVLGRNGNARIYIGFDDISRASTVSGLDSERQS